MGIFEKMFRPRPFVPEKKIEEQKILVTEARADQASQKEEFNRADIVSYIENKISAFEHRLRDHEDRLKANKRIRLDFNPSEIQTEIERLATMKKAINRGEYRGVNAELQEDTKQKQEQFEDWKKQLSKELPEDDKFYELKQKILRTEKMLNKAADKNVQAHLHEILEDYKKEQENTERRYVLRRMEKTQSGLRAFANLQKLVAEHIESSAK